MIMVGLNTSVPEMGERNDYAEESRDMVRPTGMRKTPP